MSTTKYMSEVGDLLRGGGGGDLSQAEIDHLADEVIGSAVAKVATAVNEGDVPFNAFSGLALVLVGARCLRDVGWSETQALEVVADAFAERAAAAGSGRAPN